jgi:hypothetical protein
MESAPAGAGLLCPSAPPPAAIPSNNKNPHHLFLKRNISVGSGERNVKRKVDYRRIKNLGPYGPSPLTCGKQESKYYQWVSKYRHPISHKMAGSNNGDE